MLGAQINVPVTDTVIGIGWGSYLASVVLALIALVIGVELFVWAFRLLRNMLLKNKRTVFLTEWAKGVMIRNVWRGPWNE